jgi:hypothetical protein
LVVVAASASSAADSGGNEPQQHEQQPAAGNSQPLLAREMPLLRRLATAPSAHAAADLLHDWVWQRQQQQQQQQQEPSSSSGQQQQQQPPFSLLPLSEADAELLIAASLERGNVSLALGLYDEMALVAGGGLGGGGGSGASTSYSMAPSSSSGFNNTSNSSNGTRRTDDSRTWPPLTLRLTTALVLALCRAMRVSEALRVLARVRSRGGPVAAGSGPSAPPSVTSASMSFDDGGSGASFSSSAAAATPLSDAAFGLVVRSPLPPHGPLTVVPPHEGAQAAADSASRYEFELFSGEVAAISSEALPSSGGGVGALLGAALRSAGLTSARAGPPAAVHELVVRSPSGLARTFRAASATADVPARVGERVTVVCSPQRNAPSRAPRRRLLLTPSPPGSRPGEPLEVTNHASGAVMPLLRAPAKGSTSATGGVPGWAVPLAVLVAGSDAASALVDPALPALLAAGFAATAVSAVAGSTVLVPKLKQLPAASVEVEAARQKLLAQHQGLALKAAGALAEARDDVRALSRLWQLQAKMEAVDNGAGGGAGGGLLSSGEGGSPSGSGAASPDNNGGSGAAAAAAAALAAPASSSSPPSSSLAYGARIGRVAQARSEIEQRLARRLELLDGYARVMAMIEIEIELDLRDFAELLQLQGGGGGGGGGFGEGGAPRGVFGEAAAAAAAWGGGIGEAEMARLAELEALREEWASQAEARDEVERLLRL